MSLDVWNELKNELQNRLSRAQYIHWINPISAKLDNKNLNLYCPNKMIKIFVVSISMEKYLLMILKIFKI